MRVDDLLLAFLVRWIVEDAHRGNVHHHPLMGSRRQDELRGNDHFAADPRQPGIDAGIRQQHFLIAHVEAPCDIGQRVVLADDGLLNIAHHLGVGIDVESMRGHRRGQFGRGRRRLHRWGRFHWSGAEQRAADHAQSQA
jgi:hypothetical protein